MQKPRIPTLLAASALALLAACGGNYAPRTDASGNAPGELPESHPEYMGKNRSTIWDIFKPSRDENIVSVNRYIWHASLDVLSFLPIQSVDPFTGVIVTGYGIPPGGGQAYRATVLIDDPALEARSLKLSLQDRSGRPVSTATQRAVEDAILARARQLRGGDAEL